MNATVPLPKLLDLVTLMEPPHRPLRESPIERISVYSSVELLGRSAFEYVHPTTCEG